MTMQIDKSQTLAGFPITRVRGFLRWVVAWHHNDFGMAIVRDWLFANERTAASFVEALNSQGYVKELKNGRYEFTDKARALAKAPAAGWVKRNTAEAALAGLLQRVNQYNSDEHKLLYVDAVVVFGSFLSDREELGDLNITYIYSRRIGEGYTEMAVQQAIESDHWFSSSLFYGDWPEIELRLILKARKRTIRLLHWDAFLTLTHRDHFDYKIVYGSADMTRGNSIVRVRSAA